MPSDVLFGIAKANRKELEPPEHITELLRELRESLEKAQQNLRATQVRQKQSYDVKHYLTQFSQGDLLCKCDDTTKVEIVKKLRPIWIGLYIVKEVLSPRLYRVRD